MTVALVPFGNAAGSVAHDDVEQNGRNEKTTVSLVALKPTPLAPQRIVKRRVKAVLALKQIEFLEVTQSHNTLEGPTYAVGIYYRETQSRIPVHRQFRPCSPTIEDRKRETHSASVTLQVKFESFMRLAYSAHEMTRLNHVMDTCSFCRSVIFYNSTSRLKPRWNMHWFKSERGVCETLSAYLNELLRLAVSVPTCGVDLCHGQERVPRLLQKFLQPLDAERQSL